METNTGLSQVQQNEGEKAETLKDKNSTYTRYSKSYKYTKDEWTSYRYQKFKYPLFHITISHQDKSKW